MICSRVNKQYTQVHYIVLHTHNERVNKLIYINWALLIYIIRLFHIRSDIVDHKAVGKRNTHHSLLYIYIISEISFVVHFK